MEIIPKEHLFSDNRFIEMLLPKIINMIKIHKSMNKEIKLAVITNCL